MTVTGHKSEASIKKYTHKTPNVKKHQMFNELSSKMVPPKKKPTEEKIADENTPQLGDFDLLDNMDMDDDADLLAFVEKVEKETGTSFEAPPPPVQEQNALQIQAEPKTQEISMNIPMQMQWQNFQKFTSNMPAMFFPNSNVTINYNFK